MINNKKTTLGIKLVLIFVTLSHMGSQDTSSIDGRPTPSVNFIGQLKDTAGNTINVEFITINHLIKQIDVYAIPTNQNQDPRINKTKIDLSETSKIVVPDQTTFLTFQNRNYIAIEITSGKKQAIEDTNKQSLTNKDKVRNYTIIPTQSVQKYIIEADKRIYCSAINEAGPLEKDLSFQAIVSLSITQFKLPDTDTGIDNKKTTL